MVDSKRPPASATLPARLHHHAFVTDDQEATRAFYEDIVGLPLVATWTEVEDLMGLGEQEFCHTFFGLGDGGSLAFFQFADRHFSDTWAPPVPLSPFRHVALLVSAEGQKEIEEKARAAGIEPLLLEHGYCRSLYLNDPNGLLLEFTADHPDVKKIDAIRAESAHRDLKRWLSGDHSSNNDWRPEH